MKLSLAAGFAALVALALPVTAQLTEQQIVNAINEVATMSSNSNSALQPLSTATPGNQVATFEAALVTNFGNIISAVNATIPALVATPPFPDVVQNVHSRRQTTPGAAVVAALDDFVAIHQAFLATVIGKHSIFAQFGLTAPIAAVLRSLEAVVDTFAFALIAVIPTQATVSQLAPRTISSDQAALDDAIGNTIDTYDEICIPSVLYPIVLPVCTSV